MEGAGVSVEGMGISDFGMQIAGKEGAGFRGKTSLQLTVGSLQEKQEAMQDAGYRSKQTVSSTPLLQHFCLGPGPEEVICNLSYLFSILNGLYPLIRYGFNAKKSPQDGAGYGAGGVTVKI